MRPGLLVCCSDFVINPQQADNAPSYIHKYVMGSPYSFEFHLIWKVASTSFPSYLDCAYGNESVTEVGVGTKIREGFKVGIVVTQSLRVLFRPFVRLID